MGNDKSEKLGNVGSMIAEMNRLIQLKLLLASDRACKLCRTPIAPDAGLCPRCGTKQE